MVKYNRDGRRIMLRVTSEHIEDRVLVRGVLYVGHGGRWWRAEAMHSFIRARGVTDADVLAIEELRMEIVQHLHANFRAWMMRERRARRSP